MEPTTNSTHDTKRAIAATIQALLDLNDQVVWMVGDLQQEMGDADGHRIAMAADIATTGVVRHYETLLNRIRSSEGLPPVELRQTMRR
jgi:hypothetical protein